MTARRITGTCSNPLCRKPIYRDQLDALELAQVQPDPNHDGVTMRATWRTCGIGCAITYLQLCSVRSLVQADPQWAER